MVAEQVHRCSRCHGSLMIELLVAMAILAGTLLPIAYSVAAERRFVRAAYQRAAAMEIVDGEMEALTAGGWRSFTNGVTVYPVHARALTNLPPGQFLLTLTSEKLRLEWQPNTKQHGGAVAREVRRQ
jgi:Tfp pilus assembly protein PilV